MRQDLTYIVIPLDASGSMSRITEATISGLNKFLDEQRKQPGEVRVRIVKFDSIGGLRNSKPRLVNLANNINLKDFAGITVDNYVPDGGTPLYYTQSKLIDEAGEYLAKLPEDERPGKVIFATVTDGGDTDEYYHPEHDRLTVKRKIEHQRSVYNWDFTYVGANQNAEEVAAGMGILRGKALTYGATGQGVTNAFMSMANYTTNVRSVTAVGGNTEAVAYTEEDKQVQGTAKPPTSPARSVQPY